MHGRFGLIHNDNRGFVHYSLLLLITGVIILLTVMLIENNRVVLVRDKLDNQLTDAVLSGIVYDYEKMYLDFMESNQKYDGLEVLPDRVMVNCRIKPEDTVFYVSEKITEAYNSSLGLNNVVSDFKVKRIIVYNVGKNLEITTFADEEMNCEYIENYTEYTVKTPNNVVVKTSCVYAEIVFDLTGLTGRKNNLVLSKCVEICRV